MGKVIVSTHAGTDTDFGDTTIALKTGLNVKKWIKG